MSGRTLTKEDYNEVEELLKSMETEEYVPLMLRQSAEETMEQIDDAAGVKARKSMINAAKDRHIKNTVDALDELIQTVGGIAVAGAAGKNAKKGSSSNANSKKMQQAKNGGSQVALEKNGKMAAGAEGYDPYRVNDSINTDGMSAMEGINMKNNLQKAAGQITGINNKFSPSEFNLDEFMKEETKVNANDAMKVRANGKKPLMMNFIDKIMRANQQGYELFYDEKLASRDAYDKMMQKPIQIIQGRSILPSYEDLKNSTKDKQGNVYEKNVTPKGSLPANSASKGKLSQEEYKFRDGVISFMDFMNKNYPEYAKEILLSRGDLGLRSDKGPKISDGAFKLVQSEIMNGNVPRSGKALDIRVKNIEEDILSTMTTDEIIENCTKVFGEKLVQDSIKYKGVEDAKKGLVTGLALLTASFMYSEEKDKKAKSKEDKKLDKLTKKVVNNNIEQLYGEGSRKWVKDKEGMWNAWFRTFSPDRMENAEDFDTYLEAKDLLDGYRKGQSIITNSGATDGITELLINPKYIRLILKYDPDDPRQVFTNKIPQYR